MKQKIDREPIRDITIFWNSASARRYYYIKIVGTGKIPVTLVTRLNQNTGTIPASGANGAITLF